MSRTVWIVIAAAGVLVFAGIAGLAVAALFFDLDLDDDDTSGRCQRPANNRMETIAEGLDTGLALGDGQAVKSRDFEQVWFIAAPIDGAGGIGVWATNSRIGRDGPIFSANDVAQRHSDWGPMPDLQPDDDGLAEAEECVA